MAFVDQWYHGEVLKNTCSRSPNHYGLGSDLTVNDYLVETTIFNPHMYILYVLFFDVFLFHRHPRRDFIYTPPPYVGVDFSINRRLLRGALFFRAGVQQPAN